MEHRFGIVDAVPFPEMLRYRSMAKDLLSEPANDEMREFVASYEFAGGNWMLGIPAASREEAEQRIEAVRQSITILGPATDFLPTEFEYRGSDGAIRSKDD